MWPWTMCPSSLSFALTAGSRFTFCFSVKASRVLLSKVSCITSNLALLSVSSMIVRQVPSTAIDAPIFWSLKKSVHEISISTFPVFFEMFLISPMPWIIPVNIFCG